METTKKTQVVGIKNAGIVIICCLVIAVCIFQFLLGNPSNFMNNDPNNHPLNMLGTIYKGGIIVPIIQTLLLTVLALSIERYFALRSAFGKGSLSKFVANIKDALAAGDMKKAQEICDKQRGSVANVVTSTLRKYEEMEKNTALPKEQKLLAIPVSYTHLRAHETDSYLVCRLLLEKKKNNKNKKKKQETEKKKKKPNPKKQTT